MKIAVACPNCQKRYQIAAELAGKRAKCTQCETKFTVPAAAAPAAAKASPATSARPVSPAAKPKPAAAPAAAARPAPQRAAAAPSAQGRIAAVATARSGAPSPANGSASKAEKSFFEDELDSIAGSSLDSLAAAEVASVAQPRTVRKPAPVAPTPKRASRGAHKPLGGKLIAGIGSLAVGLLFLIVKIVIGIGARQAVKQVLHDVQAPPAQAAQQPGAPPNFAMPGSPDSAAPGMPNPQAGMPAAPQPQVPSGPSRFETLARELIAVMRRMADLLETIHDRPSAETVLPELRTILARIETLTNELDALTKRGISQQDHLIDQQLTPEASALAARINAQFERLSRLNSEIEMSDVLGRMKQHQQRRQERDQQRLQEQQQRDQKRQQEQQQRQQEQQQRQQEMQQRQQEIQQRMQNNRPGQMGRPGMPSHPRRSIGPH